MTHVQDVEQTGTSDLPWSEDVQGNPPEGSYRIIGVAPEVRSWGDGNKMREYRISLRNHAGVEKQGIELSRFHEKPAPKVGDDITGEFEKQGKYLKFKEAKKGGGGFRGGFSPKDTNSIQAQTAVKAGVEIAIAAAAGQPTDPATLTQNAAAAAKILHATIRELAA